MSLQFFEIRCFLLKIIDIPSDTQIKCPSYTPTCHHPPKHTSSALVCLMCLCVGATAHMWTSEVPIFPLA